MLLSSARYIPANGRNKKIRGKERERAREKHGRSSARGPSDRTLIPFKGEARGRCSMVPHVGAREEGENQRERERETLQADSIAHEGTESRCRTGVCGGEMDGGGQGG